MPDAIYVTGTVIVPRGALEMSAVRSSGPGGQNVNKVSSKVELRVDLDRIEGLDEDSRSRLRRLLRRRLDRSGRLLVTSQRTRYRERNLEDAREKIRVWIARALVPRRARVRTVPKSSARERRLELKRRLAKKKEKRRRPSPEMDF